MRLPFPPTRDRGPTGCSARPVVGLPGMSSSVLSDGRKPEVLGNAMGIRIYWPRLTDRGPPCRVWWEIAPAVLSSAHDVPTNWDSGDALSLHCSP